MAAKPKKGKTVDKWRKKKFYSILAPKIFQERELCQAIAYDPTSLDGRTLKVNLMPLTGNIRKQDINMTFRVNKVQGDTASTYVYKYEISPAAIKRRVRRMRDRLDESFTVVTKDNKVARIKPLTITGIKTSKSVKTALRKEMIRFIISTARKIDFDTLVMDVVNDKFQKDIARHCNHIVPIRFVNIRMLQYVKEQKPAAAKPEETKPVEAKPVEAKPAEDKPVEAKPVEPEVSA